MYKQVRKIQVKHPNNIIPKTALGTNTQERGWTEDRRDQDQDQDQEGREAGLNARAGEPADEGVQDSDPEVGTSPPQKPQHNQYENLVNMSTNSRRNWTELTGNRRQHQSQRR